jgi:hypothetical protein
MTRRLFFVLTVLAGLCFGAEGLSAQGMSEDYLRARTFEKFSRPHGLSIELDLFAHAPWFDQMQKVRGHGLPGDRIGHSRDLNGPPIGLFPDAELRVRFTWHDSIQAGYSFHILQAFTDELDEQKRWNGIIYPEGVDLKYDAEWHDFRLHYRRDILRLGLTRNFTLYGVAGLEWGIINTSVESDTFPVQDNRERERFRELLPWWNVGAGFEMELGQSIRIGADVRGTYAVGYPTFQKRDDSNMKQSVHSLTGVASFEYRLVQWVHVVARAKFRYLKVRLYGGDRQDNFLWYSVGPEVGFGFRF